MQSASSLPIIIAIVFLVITMIIVFFVVRAFNRRRAKKAEEMDNSEVLQKGAKGEGVFEDLTYTYKHFRGTDKAPPYVSITIPCVSPGAFKIAPETKFDRFFKKMGVSVELQLNDPQFDERFYISTNKIPFTRSLLERTDDRKTIHALFDLGFNHLKHDGKTLTLTWQKFPRKKRIEMEVIKTAVAQLAPLVRALPGISSYEPEVSIDWKVKRFAAFAIPGFLLLSGLVALIMGVSNYQPLDGGKTFLYSLKFSIPFMLLFGWLALHLLKGRSTSHVELIVVWIISFIAFPLGTAGYVIYFNGALDKSDPVVHEARVVHKYYSRSKNSYSYYAQLESWRENRDVEKIKVSKKFYNNLTPGDSTMTITTKKGELGFEWIVGFIKDDNTVE